MRKIELLAPARDYATGVAAIDCGADAIYIGGSQFGARQGAANATDDVARLVEYARGYGVRVYATINTIIYDSELEKARRMACELIEAGVDALIVQDMALMRMGLEGVEMHASTQTSNTTPEGVKFLERSEFSRVILERGLSLEQIRAIRDATQCELECFVHGAICVGVSGKCYLSRSMGSRSGNRGECGQPCRLSYDLIDEKGSVIVADKHLLSVRDMNLSPRIGGLLDAGVSSFKIEGRLKDVGYVRNVVGYYRRILDREIALRKGLVRSSDGQTKLDFEPDPRRSFTRSGSLYFIDGKKRGVASIDTPKSAGVFLGRVASIAREHFVIETSQQLSAGDGICFFRDGQLLGTNINRVEGRMVFPNRMDDIVRGAEIFRNFDHLFTQSLEHSRARRTVAVKARVEVTSHKIVLTLCDESGIETAVQREGEFAPSLNPQKMVDTLKTQISRSGDTIFAVESVDVVPADSPGFVPVSLVGELRREALEQLRTLRCKRVLPRNIVAQEPSAPYPSEHLDGSANVVNALAEEFYRDHGVSVIERGFDERSSLAGEVVMTTPYCIRREIGECLREGTKLRSQLRLRRGSMLYRCEFDCAACEMKLIKER